MHDNQRSHRRPRSGSGQGRGRRRGGSRDRGYSDSNSSSNNSSYSNGSPSRSHAPRKLSFWQKLVSLFTGKPKTSSRSSSSRSGESRSTERQSGSSHRRFESAAPGAAATPARQAGKPELVEVSSPKIYVGNLSFDASESDLYELFNGVGKVQNAEIVSNKYTQKSKGFAFVTMLTVDEARRAVTELHDKDFMGRKLVVSGAKTGDIREGGASRSQEAPAVEAPAQEEIHPVSPVE